MAYTIRVSLAGYNALTDSTISHYSLYADSDNVLIKEHSRGSSDVASNPTITHNVGAIPLYFVMGKRNAGEWRVANSYDPLGDEWIIYTTTSTLYFNEAGSSYDDYKYYIFYDEM